MWTQVVALHWYPDLKSCEENVNTVVQILPTDVCDDTVGFVERVVVRVDIRKVL